MRVLILVEHEKHEMRENMRHLVMAANILSNDVTALVVGQDVQNIAEQAALVQGVTRVVCVDSPNLNPLLAENIAAVVVQLASDHTYFLAAASTFGKGIWPRVAANLDVMQVSDVIRVVNADTFEHPVYAGNAIQTVRVLDEKKVLTIRTTAFEAAADASMPCVIESVLVDVPQVKINVLGYKSSVSGRPTLLHAKKIVSGGRGLQSAEQFKLIEALADKLNAAVGATRAAVDAGFISNEHQVGQTGKIVAPLLYFAIGISGAIQHVAGMKDSKIIVAINKDEQAPIFNIATYGLVGDLFEIIPEMIQALEN